MSGATRHRSMTVTEFEAWQPPAGAEDRRWHLIDGEPVCMAPASEDHGAIQSEAAYLITAHLRVHRPGCRVVTAPGVVPNFRSVTNERIPDLGVTCTRPVGARAMVNPILLIEILSPSNEAMTRSNVWTYLTIPSVQEILLLSSMAICGELLRRNADGSWPDAPRILDADAEIWLDSIAMQVELKAFYRTTSLVMPYA